MKALVVALGNPLAGEDGFGARVLERLRQGPDSPKVDLMDAHTDLLGQLDRFASYRLIILLDALLEPSLGSCVAIVEEPELLAFSDDAPSIHQISPIVALKLFRQLHPKASTRFVLIALRTPELSFSGALSDAIIAQGADQARFLLRTASR